MAATFHPSAAWVLCPSIEELTARKAAALRSGPPTPGPTPASGLAAALAGAAIHTVSILVWVWAMAATGDKISMFCELMLA